MNPEGSVFADPQEGSLLEGKKKKYSGRAGKEARRETERMPST